MPFMIPFIPLIASVVAAGATVGSKFIKSGDSATDSGSSATSSVPASTAAIAPAHSTITGAGVNSGTSQQDFINNQNAYWQQFLQGTGQNPGGILPPGIQQNINQQASLLGS